MQMQQVMEMSRSNDMITRMRIMLAIHCAPILKGIKAANIMTVDFTEAVNICRMLGHTSIYSRILKTHGNRCILYMYRKDRLEAYLRRPENKEFLAYYGYQETDVYSMIDRLSGRIAMYADGQVEFPHEIGIFLEYPMQDVKGFVENKGENCSYSGYWKVYGNVAAAKKRFAAYDEKRELVLHEIVCGKSICDIAS